MQQAVSEKQQFSSEAVVLAALTMVPGWGRVAIRSLIAELDRLQLSLTDWWQQPSLGTSVTIVQEESLHHFKNIWSLVSLTDHFAQYVDTIITCFDPIYPDLLKKSEDPPTVLFSRGEHRLLKQPCLAVVGTRRISPYGKLVIAKIVPRLVADGWIIVSGVMYGVDEAAHRQTISVQGKTVGVLGYGFGATTAASQQQLQAEMLKANGVLITEYPPLVPASKGSFVQRNRIIAGLSYGTVVVEAAAQSGSLITAQCALDAGRTVFAVPGSIASPFSEGTKELLNQGATLVSSAREITQELQPQLAVQKQILHQSQQHNETAVVSSRLQTLLKQQPSTVEQLAVSAEKKVAEIITELQRAELEGHVYRDGEVWYAAHL